MFSDISNVGLSDLASSLFWVIVTLMIWLLCTRITDRISISFLRNPLFFGIIALCILLPLADVNAADYLDAVRPLTFLVSLATVALALPLWQQRTLIHANAKAMFTAALVATVTGIGSAVLIGWLLGLELPYLASMGPKMTTLAVALPLSRSTGGWDNLTMLCVMCNGIGGSFISSPLWNHLMPRSGPEERAFALGTTSHAMGIARTFALTPEFVSFSSCGMLLSALLTVVLYTLASILFGV